MSTDTIPLHLSEQDAILLTDILRAELTLRRNQQQQPGGWSHDPEWHQQRVQQVTDLLTRSTDVLVAHGLF